MARPEGSFPFSSNFEVKKAGTLDARQLLQDLNDLYSYDASNYITNGFPVAVYDSNPENRGMYMCIDKDNLSNPASWEKIGGGVDLTTDQTIGGNKTFSNNITAPDFTLSSDTNLKQNIQPVEVKPIKADWKTYQLIGAPEQDRYGVIAQELEVNHPEFVRTDSKGIKSVSYIDLLVAKNIELEDRITKLENIINEKLK